ncbi:hypothetical protein J5N97_013007 [Dioscorea zingiberensis]|uniref:Uncharacterized protein n=1 Tax=Dioscorea zingiberensis TaxID=325984 RepID=A0A9D5CQG2_9LILI|nr:hypothetical protein J5N97_013007 [Dioscorea zingiberensis]
MIITVVGLASSSQGRPRIIAWEVPSLVFDVDVCPPLIVRACSLSSNKGVFSSLFPLITASRRFPVPVVSLSKTTSLLSDHRDEIVVHIDSNRGNTQSFATAVASPFLKGIWRESSYDFLGEAGGGTAPEFSFPNQKTNKSSKGIEQNPPSRLISSILRKQRTSGAKLSLHMDFEMEELKHPSSNSISKDLCVSF